MDFGTLRTRKDKSDNKLMPFSQYLRLVDVMARMALRADASKFFLGYFWWIIEPFLYVAVFYVVFTMILVSRQPDFLYFLMTGKLIFVWFSKSVVQASNSIVTGRGLIGKIHLPKSLFPFAAVQETFYKQVSVFLLLFVILLYNGYPLTAIWWYLVPIILVNYIMILACGYVGAILVCIVRDFLPLISLGMLFLMFTSGVFWNVRDLGSDEKTQLLLNLNPFAFILDAYRQVLMYQTPPDNMHLAAIFLGFGALLLLAVLFMRRFSQFLALKALST